MDDKVLSELFESIKDDNRLRAEEMPTEQDALNVMMRAFLRLKDLGFDDAKHCPFGGSVFEAIEMGSTAIHDCSYSGEWPNGTFWVHDGGDLWPSNPILIRAKKTNKS